MSSPTENGENRFDRSLLEMLCCPVTRSRLRQEGDWLVAETGGLAYPIRDGIPVMVPESARLPEGYDSIEQFAAVFGVDTGYDAD